MRRSKTEMYIDILRVLARHGPLKLTHVMYKANVNRSVLKEYLDFIVNRGLAKEKKIKKKNRVLYGITPKGLTVLKYYRELKAVLPIAEELCPLPSGLCSTKNGVG